MGNRREQIKDNIAEVLQTKIETVKKLLAKLEEERQETSENSVHSRVLIQDSVEKISQQLTQRKTALLNEINSLGQTHLSNINRSIQHMYLLLGNLHSTLSNLDSFDNGQLMKIHIPDTPKSEDSLRTQFVIDCDYEHLLETIDNWGEVVEKISTDDTEDEVESEFVQVVAADKQSTATTEDEQYSFVVAHELKDALELKNPLGMMCSSVTSDSVPLSTLWNRERQVSLETESTSDSSILCDSVTESVTQDVQEQDLSMWLKPRTNPGYVTPELQETCTRDEKTSIFSPTPMPEPDVTPKPTVSLPANKMLLDFPGLQLEPQCWLKKTSSVGHLEMFATMNRSKKEIFPPMYVALPYPFWISTNN